MTQYYDKIFMSCLRLYSSTFYKNLSTLSKETDRRNAKHGSSPNCPGEGIFPHDKIVQLTNMGPWAWDQYMLSL